MKDILIETMETIWYECAEDGYYPDLDEVYEMALIRLNNNLSPLDPSEYIDL